MAYNIDGKPVSQPWSVVLTHARRSGVDFHVNDGRRTLRIQWARVRKHGIWSASNPTGAAYPTLGAPHINYGRANHAIDADNAAALVAFLHAHGCRSACRPIPTEAWHIQIGRDELLRFAKRIDAERKAKR